MLKLIKIDSIKKIKILNKNKLKLIIDELNWINFNCKWIKIFNWVFVCWTGSVQRAGRSQIAFRGESGGNGRRRFESDGVGTGHRSGQRHRQPTHLLRRLHQRRRQGRPGGHRPRPGRQSQHHPRQTTSHQPRIITFFFISFLFINQYQVQC